ncbi:unnamed protein product [Coregonus sp. 'balchen']|nr:unnamed protein product [Coregonus sp. 'balchen']
METEVHKFERTLLSGNKDKFAFSMTHKKLLGSKLKPQTNSSVFGSLQNLKEDKAKPVRDEYDYVSDEGELKIDEFPIRRKKRDLSFLSNIKEPIQPSKKPKLIPSDVKKTDSSDEESLHIDTEVKPEVKREVKGRKLKVKKKAGSTAGILDLLQASKAVGGIDYSVNRRHCFTSDANVAYDRECKQRQKTETVTAPEHATWTEGELQVNSTQRTSMYRVSHELYRKLLALVGERVEGRVSVMKRQTLYQNVGSAVTMETAKRGLVNVLASGSSSISVSVSEQRENSINNSMPVRAPLTTLFLHTVTGLPSLPQTQPAASQDSTTLRLSIPALGSIPQQDSTGSLPFLTLHLPSWLQLHQQAPPSGLRASVSVSAARPTRSAGKHLCPHCGRDCMKPSVLEKHMRCHTGERPYPCTTCGISFKTQSNLYKHRRTQAHARLCSGSLGSLQGHSSLSSLDSLQGHSSVSSLDSLQGHQASLQGHSSLGSLDSLGSLQGHSSLGSLGSLQGHSSLSSLDSLQGHSSLGSLDSLQGHSLQGHRLQGHQDSLCSLQGSRDSLTSSPSLDTLSQDPGSLDNGSSLPATTTTTPSPSLGQRSRIDTGRDTDTGWDLHKAGLEGILLAPGENQSIELSKRRREAEEARDEQRESRKDQDREKPLLTPSRHLPLRRQQAAIFSQWEGSLARGMAQNQDSFLMESVAESCMEIMDQPDTFHTQPDQTNTTHTQPDQTNTTHTHTPTQPSPTQINTTYTHSQVNATHTPTRPDLTVSQPRSTVSVQAQQSLEERISKLISENDAVVEDKHLNTVRPRKTLLSKQGSIDLPMPYTYKDSFHFDMRTSSRPPTASAGLAWQRGERGGGRPGLYSSVPTQTSTSLEQGHHAPLARSSSLPHNVGLQGTDRAGSASPHHSHPHHRDWPHLGRKGSSGLLYPVGFATKSVDHHASGHRPLVRQAAVDSLPTDGPMTLAAGDNLIPCGLGSDGDGGVDGELSRKSHRKKSQKFAYSKWYKYGGGGGGTFTKLYSPEKAADPGVLKAKRSLAGLEPERVLGVQRGSAVCTDLVTSLVSSSATVCHPSCLRDNLSPVNHLYLPPSHLHTTHTSSLKHPLQRAQSVSTEAFSNRTDCVSMTVTHQQKHTNCVSQRCGSHIPSERKKQKIENNVCLLEGGRGLNNSSKLNQLPGLNQPSSSVRGGMAKPSSSSDSAKTSFLPKYQLRLPRAETDSGPAGLTPTQPRGTISPISASSVIGLAQGQCRSAMPVTALVQSQSATPVSVQIAYPAIPFTVSHSSQPEGRKVFHVRTADLHICLQLISDEQLALIEPQIERQDMTSEPQIEKQDMTSEPQIEKQDMTSEPQIEKQDMTSEPQIEKQDMTSELQIEKQDMTSETQIEKQDMTSEPQIEKQDMTSETEPSHGQHHGTMGVAVDPVGSTTKKEAFQTSSCVLPDTETHGGTVKDVTHRRTAKHVTQEVTGPLDPVEPSSSQHENNRGFSGDEECQHLAAVCCHDQDQLSTDTPSSPVTPRTQTDRSEMMEAAPLTNTEQQLSHNGYVSPEPPDPGLSFQNDPDTNTVLETPGLYPQNHPDSNTVLETPGLYPQNHPDSNTVLETPGLYPQNHPDTNTVLETPGLYPQNHPDSNTVLETPELSFQNHPDTNTVLETPELSPQNHPDTVNMTPALPLNRGTQSRTLQKHPDTNMVTGLLQNHIDTSNVAPVTLSLPQNHTNVAPVTLSLPQNHTNVAPRQLLPLWEEWNQPGVRQTEEKNKASLCASSQRSTSSFLQTGQSVKGSAPLIRTGLNRALILLRTVLSSSLAALLHLRTIMCRIVLEKPAQLDHWSVMVCYLENPTQLDHWSVMVCYLEKPAQLDHWSVMVCYLEKPAQLDHWSVMVCYLEKPTQLDHWSVMVCYLEKPAQLDHWSVMVCYLEKPAQLDHWSVMVCYLEKPAQLDHWSVMVCYLEKPAQLDHWSVMVCYLEKPTHLQSTTASQQVGTPLINMYGLILLQH